MGKVISIIIPVYKTEKYLDRCVKSIIDQTYKDLEIILVDDGSPDNCPKMCDEWAKKDNRIKVIHKKNGGVSSARNIGIKECTGDYITFCDSDDYYTNDFSRVLEHIYGDTETEIFSVGLIKNTRRISSFKEKILNLQVFEDLYYMVKNNVTICCVAKIIRRDFLLNNDGYFPSGIKSEDFAWCYNLTLRCTKLKLLPNCYYVYSDNAESVTHSATIKGIEDQLLNYERVYKLICSTQFDKKQKKKLLRYLMFPYILLFRQLRLISEKDRKQALQRIVEFKYLLFVPHGIKALLYYIYVKNFYIKSKAK